MSDLPERLVSLKKERNLLQKNIAKDNDIPLRTYQYYEQGKTDPPSNIIVKLCQYFNVSADYLLGLSDDPQPRDTAIRH